MNAAEHTPTPWVVDSEEGVPGIFADDGVIVCYTGEVAGISRHFQRENCEADAAFIVLACNAHDELVTFAEAFLLHCGPGGTDSPLEARCRAALAKVQA